MTAARSSVGLGWSGFPRPAGDEGAPAGDEGAPAYLAGLGPPGAQRVTVIPAALNKTCLCRRRFFTERFSKNDVLAAKKASALCRICTDASSAERCQKGTSARIQMCTFIHL